MWQERPDDVIRARDALTKVLDGFKGVSIKVDEERTGWLRATFTNPSGMDIPMPFDELSDGQRVLIALYVLLYTQVEQGRTVAFDEPDNYVSLDEIQPFLMEALDRIQSGRGARIFIVSHHPEFINQLAPDDGYVMFREKGGPTRIQRFSASEAVPAADRRPRRAPGRRPSMSRKVTAVVLCEDKQSQTVLRLTSKSGALRGYVPSRCRPARGAVRSTSGNSTRRRWAASATAPLPRCWWSTSTPTTSLSSTATANLRRS